MSSVHPIYTLYIRLLLVLHPSLFIQSLSKNYLSFMLPFQRKSVCKDKAFFRNLQIFSKVFFEKIFGRFSEGVRLILSRSLANSKVRYSVQQSALSSVAPASLSLSYSAALPLESGCKGTHFFHSRNFYSRLFCKVFSDFYITR